MLPATTLSCEPSAIARARQWTTQIVGGRMTGADMADQLCEDIVLCVSELVTNALQAGCQRMRLAVDIDDATVRVLLSDDAPGRPLRQFPEALDLRGRGLMFVEAVADRWGVDETSEGKTTWAIFGRRHGQAG